MRTVVTHFEQVPLDAVKRIVEQQQQRDARSRGLAMGEGARVQKTEWRELCQAALVELDLEKLRERVAAAEAAVFARFQELAHTPDGGDERQALMDVSSSLRFLKRDVLRFPDWETSEPVTPPTNVV